MPNPHELFRESVSKLVGAGVPSAQNDARLIFESVLHEPQYMWPSMIDEPDAEALTSLVAKRAGRVPLQHVLGKMWFYGIELVAGPQVFSVRPETEVLAHWAIEKTRPGDSVLDLCTGSGALALAIAANRGGEVTALELSSEAAEVARLNAAKNRLNVQVVEADALEPREEWLGKFDVVVSNPPYVPPRRLDPELDFDPPAALWGGGEDGLDFIRELIPIAYSYLKPGGYFGMEHDDTQGDQTRKLAADAGFTGVQTLEDLNGRPRFLTARKSS
ncbi:MAG: peptide chain release factor N(5)-glutamine methyltransferase [Actinomycetaceae bacterium]|nr:peptide chain release factor N(5)-glutamine methyltransferase [Actinomycetaceae bacterium]